VVHPKKVVVKHTAPKPAPKVVAKPKPVAHKLAPKVVAKPVAHKVVVKPVEPKVVAKKKK
jgi:hypothetical protein